MECDKGIIIKLHEGELIGLVRSGQTATTAEAAEALPPSRQIGKHENDDAFKSSHCNGARSLLMLR